MEWDDAYCFRKEALYLSGLYTKKSIQIERMQIGFVGAGKVGVSLGKYFKEKGRKVGGYYSLTRESAEWAAAFTETKCYENLEEVVSSCDMILFTVPDSAITQVWEKAKYYAYGKLIGHCSGLYSSQIFSDTGNYAYSIHPLFAVSSKEHSWKELSEVLFTIEGDNLYLHELENFFQSMGNRTRIISAENKIKYHAAAALSSNYMTALFAMAEDLFLECGFREEKARKELYKLAKGNLDHILKQGCVESLTGPLERGDIETIEKHLDALDPEKRKVYEKCAGYLLKVAEKKHPDRDYSAISKICNSR